MKCPFCGNEETSVKDSRICDDGEGIKRRRCCPNCDARFTTIERIIKKEIFVIKKDGRKTLFDRDKLAKSIYSSAGKRLDDKKIEEVVREISKRIESSGATEIKSSTIGEITMDYLERVDKVAFIRFASVYMEFETPEDFNNFIKKISN
ncbi:MAG TPA: transcriptional regulator NrdR [Rickettsiales bacterium]|nr:transcriptional regulator NrdR [Rickettsiales bacterium]